MADGAPTSALTLPTGYPAHREADVALRDGSTVHVRPVRPSDQAAIGAFFEGLSPKSLRLRFFTAGPSIEHATRHAVSVDYHQRFGLVALAGPGGRVVGHGEYVRTNEGYADTAFAVADGLQGSGLGTILLAHLAEAAYENGITEIGAEVMPENRDMLAVFRHSGFPVEVETRPGAIMLHIPSSATPAAIERFERRERIAAASAARHVLEPRAIAVIGASPQLGTVGGDLMRNLVQRGFTGEIHPVNPHHAEIAGHTCHPRVTDVPGELDLALIAVPAAAVLEVAEQCGQHGVRALVVLSTGFAESGPEGAELQRRLVAICRSAGMRLLGPNCMGVLNTAPSLHLDATFTPPYPPRGPIGVLSQSGAVGLAILDQAESLGLGISSFVSAGNKADLSGNDFLQYWEEDRATRAILLYLESFGNPRKFGRIARRVGRRKPIVAVKSGRSPAGARATSSHTGALLAASDTTVDALFHQAGVVRTDTMSELFDVARLLCGQPAPAGPRVGIVTNAGGPAIMGADTATALGLDVVELSAELRAELATFLPPQAALGNPVDMIATASGEDFRRTVLALARSGEVDAIIAIFIPALANPQEDAALGIRRAADAIAGRLPVLAVFMSSHSPPVELSAGDPPLPVYRFAEDGARALARAAEYAAWRDAPRGQIPQLEGVDPEEAAVVLAGAQATGPGWMHPGEAAALLECFGLPLAAWRLAATPADAARAAAALGGPVALKAIAPTLVHKRDVGGVRVGLEVDAQVERAAEEMRRSVGAAGHQLEGYLVQAMAPPGVEMLVGVVHDPLFGPVVACAAGGTAVELLKDVAVRMAPLTDRDAAEMLRELACFPLLDGYRGAERCDVRALEDVVLRVSALVEAHPEIIELDLNPVIVSPHGAVVADARVRVELPTPRRPWPAVRDPAEPGSPPHPARTAARRVASAPP